MSVYNQTMTIVRRSVDQLGRVTETKQHNVRCRVETTNVRVVSSTGELSQEQYVIFAGATTDIKIGDRVTISGTGVYPEFAVKNIFVANGFGPHHLEIFV